MRELKENRRLHACQSKVVDEPPPVGNAATAKDNWTLWGSPSIRLQSQILLF